MRYSPSERVVAVVTSFSARPNYVFVVNNCWIHGTPDPTSLPTGVVVRPKPYTPLNPTVVEFRPRRDAVVVARQRIQDTVEQDTWKEGAEQTTQNPFSAPKPSASQDVIHLCLKAEEDALTPRSFLLFTTVRGKPIHGLVRENRKARRERSRWEKKEARPIARSIITGVSYPPHPSTPRDGGRETQAGNDFAIVIFCTILIFFSCLK